MRYTIDSKDMPISLWSGGKTTQIAIYPANASYADRNFTFRISTAEVELDESDFTPLPDYNRIIASISGSMELTHNGRERVIVEPLANIHYFDGSDATHCIGRASDLNLMLRKGKAKGKIELLCDGKLRWLVLEKNEIAVLYTIDTQTALFMQDGIFSILPVGKSALFRITLT